MQFFCWLAIFIWLIKKVVVFLNLAASKKTNALKDTYVLPKTELNKPILLFISICLFSTILSVDFGLSLKALFTKITKDVLLFFIIIETVNNKRSLRNILFAIIASAYLVVTDAGVQLYRGRDFLRGFSAASNELRACFTSRNGFGGWLIIISPIIFGLLATQRFKFKKTRLIALGCLFCLLLICLGLTYSRASWLGLVLSFGFLTFYLISFFKIRFKILSVFIVLLSLISLSFILPQKMKERIVSITRIENSSLFRINLWRESIEIIEDFPLLGIGLNTYSKVGPKYSKGEGGYYPHNSYLQLTAEIGVIGLFAFIWIIIKLFEFSNIILKNHKEPLILGLLTAIIAFLIHSFFDVGFYALQLATLFWFILGITIASIGILIKDKPSAS